MTDPRISRRQTLVTLTVAALGGCAGPRPGTAKPTAIPTSKPTHEAREEPPMAAQTLRGENAVQPLPFDPARLNGLSERLIRSHHENNYGGAVKNLNAVEKELSAITKQSPPFVVSALRERELTFRGSKLLHEQYFGNLGGNGKRGGSIETALRDAYGSSDRWEEHFRLTGMGLGGGSGWVILAYELDSGALRTFWSGNHTQALALSVPLLVMDMYEHSYQMDFGAAAAKYIDAFLANVDWEAVDKRFGAAQRARGAFV